MNTVEKAIAAALEPIVEEVVRLEKQVAEVAKQPGPQGAPGEPGAPGADAAPEAVAEVLAAKYAETLRGSPGKDGRDGAEGAPGPKGADAAPEAVADVLVAKHADILRGAPGADGKDGQDGAPGRDSDPMAVAEALVKDYAPLLRGKDGKDGKDGQPGADADPEAVAELLVAKHLEKLRGPMGAPGTDGKDADPEEVAAVLALTHKDILRGTDGKDGAPGRDGLGIELKAYEPGAVYREGTYVSAYLGQFFKAVRDTAAAPGDSADWERIGSSGFRHCGTFKSDAEYGDGDIFIKDYGAFMSFKGETFLLCGRGAKGERGAVGPSGADGKPGADGATIIGGEVNGFKMVFLQQDAAGNADHLEMDFEPAIRHQLELISSGFAEQAEVIVKETLRNEIWNHPLDNTATPYRFYRGNWTSFDTYGVGDVVGYSGDSYICREANTGIIPQQNPLAIEPINTSRYWRRMVAGGGGGGGGGSPPTEIPNDVLYWAPDTAYDPGDTVLYIDDERSNYVSTYRNLTGAVMPPAPTFNPLFWTKVASQNNTPWTLDRTNNGLLDGGILTVDPGFPTTVQISAGRGIIVAQGTIGNGTLVEWAAQTVDLPTLAADNVAYIGIDITGAAVAFMGVTTDVSMLTRTHIMLGGVQSDGTTPANIGVIAPWPVATNGTADTLNELINYFFKPQFLAGGGIGAIPASMTFDRDQGRAYAYGIQYHSSPGQPNTKSLPAESPVLFKYITQTGALSAPGTIVDPLQYDNAGTLTALTGTQTSIQRVFLDLIDESTYVAWGQQFYANLDEARQQVSNDDAHFVKHPFLELGMLFCGWIFVQADATDLADTTKAYVESDTGTQMQGSSQGVQDLEGLTDVQLFGRRQYQQLTYNGVYWTNQDPDNVSKWETQTNHGFSVGQAVTINSITGIWALAKADKEITLALGLVAEVATADVFRVVVTGQVSVPAHGFPIGAELYLSPTVAGGLVADPVVDGINYNQHIATVLSVSNLWVNVGAGVIGNTGQGIRRYVAGEHYLVGEYLACPTDPSSPYGEGRTICYVHTEILNSPATPPFNTNLTPTDGVFMNGSASDGTARTYQMAFGYGGQPTFRHYIKTRHKDGGVAAQIDNGFEFFTSDGTSGGGIDTALAAFTARGGKIYAGGWGAAYAAPVDPMQLVPKKYVDDNLGLDASTWSVAKKAGISGGGTLHFDNDGINWSKRFTVMFGTKHATSIPPQWSAGYYDITMPPDGTQIPGVGSNTGTLVTGGTINMTLWEILWYELPLGEGSASKPGNFHLSHYSDSGDWDPPSHWIAVAHMNGDSPEKISWCDGRITENATDALGNSSWHSISNKAITIGSEYSLGQFGLDQTVELSISAQTANGIHHLQIIGTMNLRNSVGYGIFTIMANKWDGEQLFDLVRITSAPTYSIGLRANLTTTLLKWSVMARNITTGQGLNLSVLGNAQSGTNYGSASLDTPV